MEVDNIEKAMDELIEYWEKQKIVSPSNSIDEPGRGGAIFAIKLCKAIFYGTISIVGRSIYAIDPSRVCGCWRDF